MFESTRERLQRIFQGLRGKGYLSEADVRAGLREIRKALLASDVHHQVVHDLIERVESQALKKVPQSVTPAQQLLGIVRWEMAAMMGGHLAKLRLQGQPPVVILVGPAGGGKTTTAGKLARLRQKALLVCADPYRPAAREQLETVAKLSGAAFFSADQDPISGVSEACAWARRNLCDVVIVDTPGIPPGESPPPFLGELIQKIPPSDVLLVLDALVGQEAVRIAEAFLPLEPTGIVLTKLDGDARGGAALSLPARIGRPVVFVGVGERPDDLEPFHPERMADRILGLGDLATLAEKLEKAGGEPFAQKAAVKESAFTLEDFLIQLEAMARAGPISHLLAHIPGVKLSGSEKLEQEFIRTRAIIQSMTIEERRNPNIIGASRKRRIARGSGTTVQEVNRLLNQFEQVQRLMPKLGRLPPGWKDMFKMG